MQSENALTRTQRARQQDIIQAAIRVLNAKGYAKTSVDLIAKDAGTNKSTVLYHFGSKEAVLLAVIGNAYADGAAYMKPFIEAATTMSDKLDAYITSNLRYISNNREHIAAVHQIMNGALHQMPDYNDEAVSRLVQLFRTGQKSGEFGQFDPEIMAVTLRLTIDSASFYMLSRADLDVDNYINEIVGLFNRATSIA